MADWTTKYNPFGSSARSQYDKMTSTKLNFESGSHMSNDHRCTDPVCGLLFIGCIALAGWIAVYAVENGDPRRIYHGMDWESNLCGVDEKVLNKPYVYWCQQVTPTSSAAAAAGQLAGLDTSLINPLNGIDWEHPICVEYCPMGTATQSMCYDKATGAAALTTDYATHPVAHRYCLPQSKQMMDEYNKMLDEHPINEYITLVVATIREGWQVLLGVVALAFVLSTMYLLVLECIAWLIVWVMILAMITLPALAGGCILYSSNHGGIDGIPNSGDADTDRNIGIGCLCVSAAFLCVVCCMQKAIERAIKVVEAAAQCLVDCRSLLLEPIVNLVFRMGIWLVMFTAFFFLVSVGEVRKSKVYREFTYTSEEWVYIGYFIFMFIWINDFITACSQYAIANATGKWYFTEISGGSKSPGSCLLCRGYCNIIFHFGSLAFGSLIIAFTRPIRLVAVALLFAGDVSDNAVCGCISKGCACCLTCFENLLQHICKNAFIDMAVTGYAFCAAGADAARILNNRNGAGGAAVMVNAGATFIFTLSGIGTVTLVGALVTGFVVINVETFNLPSSKYYVQDPMVMTALAGFICFFVALIFMVVFDSIADTIFLCMAKESEKYSSWRSTNMGSFIAPKKKAKPNMCTSFFTPCGNEETAVWAPPKVERQQQYAHKELEALVPGRWK